MCKSLKAVLCVDTNFINYLRNGGAPPESIAKCWYVPNYAAVELFPTVSLGDLKRRYRARRILFLRRCEEQRGPYVFLDVCEQLGARKVDFSAKMVGAGSERDRVRRLIAEKGLDRVIQLDSRDRDDVYDAIEDAPSRWCPVSGPRAPALRPSSR